MSPRHKRYRPLLPDVLLLLTAVCLLGAIRLGLQVLSLDRLLRLLGRSAWGATESSKANEIVVKRVGRAVRAASRYVPSATCLAQALTTMVILGRLGQSACLRLGVAKGDGGQLQAHAWVESQGRIIIGRLPDLSRFAVLPSFKHKIL